MTLGLFQLERHVKRSVQSTPRAELPGLPAPLAVSSPEATAIDLITYQAWVGGIVRAIEVIREFQDRLTLRGLRQLLVTPCVTADLQRLGYILDVLGLQRLAAEIVAALPQTLDPVYLQKSGPSRSRPTGRGGRWAVHDLVDFPSLVIP